MSIGNGEETKVWQDQWIDTKPARKVQIVRRDLEDLYKRNLDDLRVSDLLVDQGREWNAEVLSRLFPEEEKTVIERVRRVRRGSKDRYVWDNTKTGYYSVKSGYWVQVNIINNDPKRVIEDQPSLDLLFQMAWKTDTSPKVHHFLWRFISKYSLPVAANMVKRHIARDASCLRCGQEDESIIHVLFLFPLARLVWAVSPILAPPGGITSESLYSKRVSCLEFGETIS